MTIAKAMRPTLRTPASNAPVRGWARVGTAALLAATVFVVARALGLDAWPAALIAAPCGFALRAGALVWGWSLPAFPGTPTRG